MRLNIRFLIALIISWVCDSAIFAVAFGLFLSAIYLPVVMRFCSGGCGPNMLDLWFYGSKQIVLDCLLIAMNPFWYVIYQIYVNVTSASAFDLSVPKPVAFTFKLILPAYLYIVYLVSMRRSQFQATIGSIVVGGEDRSFEKDEHQSVLSILLCKLRSGMLFGLDKVWFLIKKNENRSSESTLTAIASIARNRVFALTVTCFLVLGLTLPVEHLVKAYRIDTLTNELSQYREPRIIPRATITLVKEMDRAGYPRQAVIALGHCAVVATKIGDDSALREAFGELRGLDKHYLIAPSEWNDLMIPYTVALQAAIPKPTIVATSHIEDSKHNSSLFIAALISSSKHKASASCDKIIQYLGIYGEQVYGKADKRTSELRDRANYWVNKRYD